MKTTKKIGAIVFAIDPMGNLRVLLRKNSPFNGSSEEWNVIYGHIETNEKPQDCVIREIKEETGIVVRKVHTGNYKISKVFNGTGQIEISYYWAFIDGVFKQLELNEESIGYQWANIKNAQEIIYDSRQASAIERCFEEYKKVELK